MINVHMQLTYIATIHSNCFRVSRTSVILYKITYMKQIEYDKHATYIATIHSKCFRVSRTFIILYKITYMKQNMTNVQLTLLPSIPNVSEYQEHPLSSIRLHT